MAWTDEEIAQLKAAIASGILTVTYAGPPARSITYQSLSQMRELLAEMTASATSGGGGSSYRLGATRKGF